MSVLSWVMDLDFAGSPVILITGDQPGIIDSDLATAFFFTDRPSRPDYFDGTIDPVEIVREGQRAVQGRPRRPPRREPD